MRELLSTFNLLYERRRLITNELDAISASIKVLQSRCEHETGTTDEDVKISNYLICGKLIKTNVIAIETLYTEE